MRFTVKYIDTLLGIYIFRGSDWKPKRIKNKFALPCALTRCALPSKEACIFQAGASYFIIMEMLSKSEFSAFKEHEKTIETTKEGFIACGNALGAIQEGKLYRAAFDTFEEYCKEKWGWERAHAYRLIEAAEIGMSPIGDKIKNESQARAIAKVPKKDRKKVLKEAAKDGDLTAAKITEAASEILDDPKKKVIVRDKNDNPIPEDLIPLWNRGQEVQDMLLTLAKMRTHLLKAQEEDDLLYRAINYSATITHIENSRISLKLARPHAVCWTCQGRNPKKCAGVCKGTGLVSKFAWDNLCPKEIKGMLCKV